MSRIKTSGLLRIKRPCTLRVYLGPQHLGSIIMQGQRPLQDSAHSVTIEPRGEPWQASVEALREHLQQTVQSIPEAGQLALEISLATRWCQMVMAPWSDALLTEPAAQRFLQTQLCAIYGEPARDWATIADDAPYASPRLVCGVDRVLLQALQKTAQDLGYRCRAVEPALSTALRTAPSGALALIEAGRITMAALHAGRITAIQSQASCALWQLELPQAWQRWTLRTPELASINSVAVVDLCPPDSKRITLAPPPLPSRFRLLDNPFGTPPAPVVDSAREAA